ncbi:LysR family transcriptional regulator [Bordetella genomosp. 7]|uniref:LysR family transcriptional regulator n=2 Tax=Alcaligenaceae TaxID=506 RepID=A0A261RK08_9BORD|nr:LysR family transcriptional regulator [Bordetella genomosp. 7]OZI25241.1 LysR family transcriptional regulator [Bordetella genomosp. 7]
MEFFVEVAKTCNFGRAAANLGVPKSTVSRQVAELERSLGLRLLSRTTRRVELTDAGLLYFERCQRIVSEAQVAHEELQKLVETPSGPLRVNMPADFGTDFLAEVFMEFSQRYPEVTFYLDLASPEHAGRVFQRCDISIEIGELPDSSQIARLLGLLPAYLYASPEYLQRHGAPRHPDDLTRHECLEFRAHDGKVTRWPLSRGDERLEITPGKRFSANSVPMVRSLASLGAGIAVLAPARSVRQDVEQRRLQRVLPGWQAGPFPVYAVTDTRLLPAKTRIFIEFLVERLRDGGLAPQHNAPLLQ